MTIRKVSVTERRTRLASRHHLAPSARVGGVTEVATDLVALHGTDPASVYLAAVARMAVPEITAVERALYDDRSLVRILGMRRTVFTVAVELEPIIQAACTRAVAVKERRTLLQHLAKAGLGDERWLTDVEESTLAALRVRGEALAGELTADEPRLGAKISLSEGKSYAAQQAISTRVLTLLAADGRIVRARPRGSWTSSQYRWSPVEVWLPGERKAWETAAAQAELAGRWLAAFGPATLADLRWWAGWTAGDAKRALAAVGAVEVGMDDGPGYVLGTDTEPVEAVEPWAALLPALDPTAMGWAGRDWYLGEHRAALFDRSGNIGPTIWWDGRIVGGWAQRGDGEVVTRLLEDIGTAGGVAVESAAARLAAVIGPVRITPRFRTPLERELVQ
jgi:Winged helix DNA-binding domain